MLFTHNAFKNVTEYFYWISNNESNNIMRMIGPRYEPWDIPFHTHHYVSLLVENKTVFLQWKSYLII